jgi:hypothetical protein
MIELHKTLEEKSYFLANRYGFFHRYADGGFKTKWCGLWLNGKKRVEYFALKTGDEWLSENTCAQFSYNYAKASHTYVLEQGVFRQHLWMPEHNPELVVQIECEKPASLELELAINIRNKHENLHNRTYKIIKHNGFTVESSAGDVSFRMLKGKGIFEEAPQYREHWPSGEQQRCLIPGRIILVGRQICFALYVGERGLLPKNALQRKEHRIRTLQEIIHCNDKVFENGVKRAALSIELLCRKEGVVAGLPWFNEYWGRDAFWSLPALVELGRFEDGARTLKLFAKYQREGNIPNYITGKECNYNAIDSSLLFVIALDHYLRYTDDVLLVEELYGHARDALSYAARRDRDKDGLIEHDQEANETWMDSINRRDTGVEIQALYVKALEAFGNIAKALGKKANVKREKERALKRLALFESNDFFFDRIKDGDVVKSYGANALVPGVLGVSDKKVVEEASRMLEFEKGIATLSKEDVGFDAAGYHTGSVWSLTTGWGACVAFKQGYEKRGLRWLNKMLADTGQDVVGCIGECWHAHTGRLMGCGAQLWGAAMVIRCVDEFMLGIQPDARNSSIKLVPRLPESITVISRRIRLGERSTWITVERSGKEVTAHSSNKKVKVTVG